MPPADEPWSEQERAFRAARYVYPELVRNLRLGLDAGCTPREIKKLCDGKSHGNFAALLPAAVAHMVTNPKAGAVRWDGLRYDWQEN